MEKIPIHPDTVFYVLMGFLALLALAVNRLSKKNK
jgi:hypothetical protein